MADQAFHEATKRFAAESTKDDRKIALVRSLTSLTDVQNALTEAIAKYETSRKHQKARKWLSNVASRLKYYGNVLDVLAQHHPEYVALAWGAMKFLFIAIINHENIISSIAEGLSDIADTLPRVDLVTALYPTSLMQNAVQELYVYLLRFFIRAHDWYQESTIVHFIHAITRPTELRYKDLIENIRRCSRNIDQLSQLGSQTELREVNNKLDTLVSEIVDLRSTITSFQSINAHTLLDTNEKVSDLQLSQIMTFVSNVPIADPIKSYQYNLFMRKRRPNKNKQGAYGSFWLSPRLQAWSSSPNSTLAIVRGSFQSRFAIRDFSVGIIEQLHKANVPVLWVIRGLEETSGSQNVSSVDVLKYLVLQALQLKPDLNAARSKELSCSRFQSSKTEHDWFQLLGSILMELNYQAYLLIDMELLSSTLSSCSENFDWATAFLGLFDRLGNSGRDGMLKVLLCSYGSANLPRISRRDVCEVLIPIVRSDQRRARNRRKAATFTRGRIMA